MNSYYEDMNQEFKKAVKVIKQYCQFEDCDVHDCVACPHPLSVIRCGDLPVKEGE